MDRSGLTSIEDTNAAGILPASRDSPKFESKAQSPGNSPLQDRHTVDLRDFRGFGCTHPLTLCTGRSSASSGDPLAP